MSEFSFNTYTSSRPPSRKPPSRAPPRSSTPPGKMPPMPPQRTGGLAVADNQFDFTQVDSDTNIELEDSGKIKAATFEKLIEKLTSPKFSDNDLLFDFLLTYRSFATPFVVVDAMIQRVTTLMAADGTLGKEDKITVFKVFNVFVHWVDKFWFDFSKDCPKLSDKLKAWLNECKKNDVLANSAKRLANKLKRWEEGEATRVLETGPKPPKSKMLKNANCLWWEEDATEIARQLTITDWKLFEKIRPWELLGQAWTKDRELAANVIKCTERFNYVSGFIQTSILTTENPRKRVRVLEKCIEVGEKCSEIKNINAVMEIVSGLNAGPVFRLKETFGAISRHHKKALSELNEIADRSRSYAKMRAHLQRLTPPCIPFLGMFLTDLTFIEEGNPDTIRGLVNFYKRRLISETIRMIQQFQQGNYNFNQQPRIQKKLNKKKILKEMDLYECSEYLETRPGKTPPEKPEALGGKKRPLSERDLHFELQHVEGYPFYPRDGPSNISVSDNGMVMYATLPKLVERVTHHISYDSSLLSPFLATFRTFTTPSELLELLKWRFNVPPSKKTDSDTLENYHKRFKQPVQLRVVNLMKGWIDRHYYDFEDDPNLLQLVKAFIDGDIENEAANYAKTLRSLLTKHEDGNSIQLDSCPAPYLPTVQKEVSDYQVLDFNPEELARQLTLLDHELFNKIRPSELYAKASQGASKTKTAPNLVGLTKRYQKTMSWASELINRSRSRGNTPQVLDALVATAEHCEKLSNWQSMRAITKALDKAFVLEMMEDWKKVSLKGRKYLNDKKALLGMKHHEELEKIMQRCFAPCVPYMAVFLESISQLEETHNTKPPSPALIPVDLYRSFGNILDRVNSMQRKPYALRPVPVIQAYLNQPWKISRSASSDSLSAVSPRASPRMQRANQGNSASNMTSIQELKPVIMDLLRNDNEFKQSIAGVIKEVWQEEQEKFLRELRNMEPQVAPATNGRAMPMDFGSRARRFLEDEFSGAPLSTWEYYDARGIVNGTPGTVSIDVLKNGHDNYLCGIEERLDSNGVKSIIAIGKAYREHNPSFKLACILISQDISPDALALCQRCKIKV
mmetsp:Transcript_26275/g.29252  ORF Transcript_26275/g.29252 Transcript_26275/m.29252 type:complete len:1079 (-) Transcript_26275:138-3374(-)